MPYKSRAEFFRIYTPWIKDWTEFSTSAIPCRTMAFLHINLNKYLTAGCHKIEEGAETSCTFAPCQFGDNQVIALYLTRV
jgi:hypothetical protein